MDKGVITKGIAGALSASALVIGGIDASVLNERPLERIETVAEYRVEAKQIGNLVETTFPWKDQEGLKVVVDLGEPTMAERMADKRKREVVTETVDFGDGGFKVDILLHERPNTNRFCYTIEGAEDYDFIYQPPLTKEEIAEGAYRPPEMEGSYAVFHKTLRDGEYQTGKVMHIPRPQVWSLADVEVKQWADLSYENGELCVTAPEKFLATAELPIRIDPTFGYTSIGATAGTTFGNEAYGLQANLPAAGDVSKLSAYILSGYNQTSQGITANNGSTQTNSTDRKYVYKITAGASGTVISGSARIWNGGTVNSNTNLVIYSDNAGAPNALLAVSNTLVVNTGTSESARSYTFSGANRIALANGTDYWIGVHFSDPGTGNISISRANNSNLVRSDGDTYSDGPADPCSCNTLSNGGLDIYVNIVEDDSVKPAIWEVTSSPHSLIASGSGVTVTGADGWKDFTLAASIPADDYHLGVIAQNRSIIYYDADGTASTTWDATNSYTTPDDLVETFVYPRRFSIYATYTESSSGSSAARQDVIWFD